MKISNRFRKIVFHMRWMTMSPRERYTYLWARGGSLRELRPQPAE